MKNRKAIFDAVRRMIGRGFTGFEVVRLDKAIDQYESAVIPDAPSEPETEHVPSAIGPDGIALIKRFEGCARLRPDGLIEAYPDPASGGDPWTIGWGATGPGIRAGTVWSQAQCDERLERDLMRYAGEVVEALGSAIFNTSQAQFDALVSFHYNTGAIGRATLTRLHKAGKHDQAQAQFGLWVNAAGRRIKGLVRRRAAEAELYGRGI